MFRDDRTITLSNLQPYREEGQDLLPFVEIDHLRDLAILPLACPTMTRAPSTEYPQTIRIHHRNHC